MLRNVGWELWILLLPKGVVQEVDQRHIYPLQSTFLADVGHSGRDLHSEHDFASALGDRPTLLEMNGGLGQI